MGGKTSNRHAVERLQEERNGEMGSDEQFREYAIEENRDGGLAVTRVTTTEV